MQFVALISKAFVEFAQKRTDEVVMLSHKINFFRVLILNSKAGMS